MDEMTITAKTVIEAKWTLQELESAFAWARIGVEPGRISIYVACYVVCS